MARSSGFVWIVPPSVIGGRIAQVPATIRLRVADKLTRWAAIGEAEMKVNARWQNRTGAARSGLYGEAAVSASSAEIRLGHGVDYGIWLEISNQARYAIVGPTVETLGPRVMADLGGIL